MLTKMINVSKLEGQDLDYWVAKALGYNILGKALACYDPENGYPSIVPSQQVTKTGIMQTHERYFYLIECGCDICDTIYEEMRQTIPGPGLELEPEPRVLGHDWRCLYAVPSYSTTVDYIAQIMVQGQLMVTPVHNNNIMTWIAKNVPKNLEEPIYNVAGKTIEEAVMRAFVSMKYGLIIYD